MMTVTFEKPTLSEERIVRVLKTDQRVVLTACVKKQARKRCPACESRAKIANWKFGYVYIAKTHQVTGVSFQCQHCAAAWVAMFEPADSLTLRQMEVPKNG